MAFSRDGRSVASAASDGTVRVWEAAPPPAETLVEREAVVLVNSLFSELVRKREVLERIQGNTALNEPVRRAATVEAENYHPDPVQLNDASWAVVSKPSAKAPAYRRALLQADEACRLAPNDGNLLNTLGVAQYRVGKYQKAVETLTRSDQMNSAQGKSSLPEDLAFLAMAHHQLGQKEKAQACSPGCGKP